VLTDYYNDKVPLPATAVNNLERIKQHQVNIIMPYNRRFSLPRADTNSSIQLFVFIYIKVGKKIKGVIGWLVI
jgi:hypothetical protein